MRGNYHDDERVVPVETLKSDEKEMMTERESIEYEDQREGLSQKFDTDELVRM